MFTHKLLKENQSLIDFALKMHQEGTLLPDTYLLDVDQIIENGRQIVKGCKDDIVAIFMLKQVGRNPYIAKKLMDVGFKGAVAVDFKDAQILMKHKIPIRNIGHIVQPPKHFLEAIMAYGVEHITVYSYQKAKEIEEIAKKLQIKQKILLKVYGSKDNLYPGQVSGVNVEQVLSFANQLSQFDHLMIDGLTTFPAFIYQEEKNDILGTENLHALLQAKDILLRAGYNLKEYNLPSSNCVHNMELARQMGATTIEPGHALTGTTMMNAGHNLPEKIAYLYLSEVSHTVAGKSYIYGGGYYARGRVNKALITNKLHEVQVNPLPAESIDYYLELDGSYEISQPAILCFRTQMFVTRSTIALVEGLHKEKPHIQGLYKVDGSEYN